MDNKEELKRSLAEEEQRAKDSLANVEKMKKQLEELNKKEEQPTVSATGVYLETSFNNKYFFVYTDNSIGNDNYTNTDIDNSRLEINNIFRNGEQAKQEALRREGQEFIRRCAMLWNKGNDWRKKENCDQWYITYNKGNICLSIFNSISTGQVFFDNEELGKRCIAELKAKYNEEQIKVIFGVK